MSSESWARVKCRGPDADAYRCGSLLHCLADISYACTTQPERPTPHHAHSSWPSTVWLHDSIYFLLMAFLSLYSLFSLLKIRSYFNIYKIPITGRLQTFWNNKCAQSSPTQKLVFLPCKTMVFSFSLELFMGFRSMSKKGEATWLTREGRLTKRSEEEEFKWFTLGQNPLSLGLCGAMASGSFTNLRAHRHQTLL